MSIGGLERGVKNFDSLDDSSASPSPIIFPGIRLPWIPPLFSERKSMHDAAKNLSMSQSHKYFPFLVPA